MSGAARSRRGDQPDEGWGRQLRLTGYLAVAVVVLLAAGGAFALSGVSLPWPRSAPAATVPDAPATEVRFPDPRIPDLATAVAATPIGGVLRLAPGAYTLDETLVLRHSLTIVGAGAGVTTIASSVPGAVVRVGGEPHVHVRGVTFRHTGGAPANVLFVRLGPAGRLSLADCSLGGALVTSEDDYEHGSGVDIRGPSRVTLRRCAFGENPLSIAVAGSSRVGIRSCRFTDSGTGVAVMERADVTVDDSVFRDNPGTGLWVAGGSATVRDSTCIGNRYGFSAFDSGRLTVSESRVERNRRCGIEAFGRARLEVDGSTIHGNCVSGEQPGVGIHVGDRARAVITACDCGNRGGFAQRGGILVDGRGRARIELTTCIANREYGVLFTDSSSGTTRSLRCSGSPDGLLVGPEATVL